MNDNDSYEELETDSLLTEEEERLPWLESAEDYEENGNSAFKVIGILLIGLFVVGAVIGSIYLIQQRNAEIARSGGGQLIKAQEGDYKIAPEDAGGKEFAGTGDASPAAAEGQERVAALGGDDKKAPAGSVLVQLGAYSSEAKANTGWTTLSGRYGYIAKLPKKIAAAKVDGGTVYRLSAVAPDAASANSVCGRLKSAGQSCLVVR